MLGYPNVGRCTRARNITCKLPLISPAVGAADNVVAIVPACADHGPGVHGSRVVANFDVGDKFAATFRHRIAPFPLHFQESGRH